MNSAFRVQVVRRGVITLPRQVRVANNIQEGDTLTLIDLGGAYLFSVRFARRWTRSPTGWPGNGRRRASRSNPC